MNSFLFIHSTRVPYWQKILAKDESPVYQDQSTLLFSERPVGQNSNIISVVNSPLIKLLENSNLQLLQNKDPNFLIGQEAAILSFNSETKQILIARDFPGTETLYYYLTEQELIISDSFLSFKELKLTKELSELKVLEYLTGEFSSTELTLWENILKVLPGQIIEFQDYQIKSKNKIQPIDLLNLKSTSSSFSKILQQEMKQYRPLVNCELSGGLDSMTLADTCWKLLGSESLKSYSILFPEFICDETTQINNFLQLRPHYNSKSNFKVIDLLGLQQLSNKLAYFPDYPNSLSSLAYLKIFNSKNYQVLVDGFGGDQLFNLWKVKKEFSSIDHLKSKLLNDFKLRKIFRKRVFPWLTIDAECNFLSHWNQRQESFPSDIKNHQLALLQQLFSPDFSEYLESACLVAKSQQVYRSHPFLRKEMIAFALNLSINDLTKKNFLKLQLRDSLGSHWTQAKKADFSETFLAYIQQPELLEVRTKALDRFQDIINLQSFNELMHPKNRSSKQLLVNWNLIGLEIAQS